MYNNSPYVQNLEFLQFELRYFSANNNRGPSVGSVVWVTYKVAGVASYFGIIPVDQGRSVCRIFNFVMRSEMLDFRSMVANVTCISERNS